MCNRSYLIQEIQRKALDNKIKDECSIAKSSKQNGKDVKALFADSLLDNNCYTH